MKPLRSERDGFALAVHVDLGNRARGGSGLSEHGGERIRDLLRAHLGGFDEGDSSCSVEEQHGRYSGGLLRARPVDPS